MDIANERPTLRANKAPSEALWSSNRTRSYGGGGGACVSRDHPHGVSTTTPGIMWLLRMVTSFILLESEPQNRLAVSCRHPTGHVTPHHHFPTGRDRIYIKSTFSTSKTPHRVQRPWENHFASTLVSKPATRVAFQCPAVAYVSLSSALIITFCVAGAICFGIRQTINPGLRLLSPSLIISQ